jgi:hypothetical protein
VLACRPGRDLRGARDGLERPGLGLALGGPLGKARAIAPDAVLHPLGQLDQELLGQLLAGLLRLALHAREVADVLALLDLAEGALPVRVVRAELLRDRGEAEPQPGVADLLLGQLAHLALDVAVELHGRDLLDAHEVLLVEHLRAVEQLLEPFEELFQILRLDLLLLDVRAERHSPLSRAYQTW